jgi:uncharacterized protein YndB with AHSA1/START domain
MTLQVSNSITIARPIEDVFAVLTDVENTEKWWPSTVKEWWTSEPPHGLGSTRHAVSRIGPFRSENDAVVTEYEPPRRGAMRGTSRNAPFEATLSFRSVEGGTRVDVVIALFLRGAARLVGPLFLRWYGRNWERGVLKLKRMMESGEL